MDEFYGFQTMLLLPRARSQHQFSQVIIGCNSRHWRAVGIPRISVVCTSESWNHSIQILFGKQVCEQGVLPIDSSIQQADGRRIDSRKRDSPKCCLDPFVLLRAGKIRKINTAWADFFDFRESVQQIEGGFELGASGLDQNYLVIWKAEPKAIDLQTEGFTSPFKQLRPTCGCGVGTRGARHP
jgi:hypothetical protein